MIYAIEATGSRGKCPHGAPHPGCIKFGKAKNARARVKVLATASPFPLRLRAAMDWPDETERLIHDAFADLRMHGEWFYPDEYLASFVSTMMCHHGASDGEKYDVCMRILLDRFLRRPCDGKCQAPDKRYIWDGKNYMMSEAWP